MPFRQSKRRDDAGRRGRPPTSRQTQGADAPFGEGAERLNALERDGWVSREPHPTDRRATLVTLTAQGRTAANDMQAGYADLATLLFGDLQPTDLARLAADLDRVLQRLRDRQSTNTDPDPACG